MTSKDIKQFLRGNRTISINGYIVKYKNNKLVIKNSNNINAYGVIQDKLNSLMYIGNKKIKPCSISFWKNKNNLLTRKEISDIIKEHKEYELLVINNASC